MSALATDVAIVGGGTAGCAAALALRRRGLRVVLLEKGLCGAMASGTNFGGVRRQGRDLREMPLAHRAREIWSRLPAIVGEDCEFRVTGHIKLARDDAEMAELEAYAPVARDAGLDLSVVGANAVRDLFPWLGAKVIGASISPDDGQANPRLVGPAFARAARAAGADIREHARVTAARWTGTRFEVEAGVLTVHARHMLNVAGYWGGEIAAWFGERVPIAPLCPNMIVTEPLPYFIDRSIGVCGGNVYVRQVERGNVIFGGGRGWGDPGLERSRPRADVARSAMARLLEVVPQLRTAQVIRSWTGFDGEMPDDIPVIGPSGTTPNLIHAFGFSGHGFQLGPAVGEILAEMVVDGRTASPIAPFAIERFTRADAERRTA
ncbi:MAG: FAD-binding oxidoreductase [Alphaproteobacteria bacterium]|nr:FAD-binding oxidoreductase [Alphaproteobacteria bacterium]